MNVPALKSRLFQHHSNTVSPPFGLISDVAPNTQTHRPRDEFAHKLKIKFKLCQTTYSKITLVTRVPVEFYVRLIFQAVLQENLILGFFVEFQSK